MKFHFTINKADFPWGEKIVTDPITYFQVIFKAQRFGLSLSVKGGPITEIELGFGKAHTKFTSNGSFLKNKWFGETIMY